MHFAQTQARPLAFSGIRVSRSAEKTASKHQQRSGVLPVVRATSMAQALGSWQIGQRATFKVFILSGTDGA